MAKKSSGGYRDIPGARTLNGAPGTNDGKKGLSLASKITLGVMGVLAVILLGLLYITTTMIHVIHYTWLIVCFASLLVFCLSILLLIWIRKVAKTNWSRLGLTCLMVVVMSVIAVAGYTFTAFFYADGEVPVGYVSSPDGNSTIVVMRSANLESQPHSDGTFPCCYTGYQMVNRFFYLAFISDSIYADGIDEPIWDVRWTESGDAVVYLPGHEGEPHSECYIYVYDMSNLEESIVEKEELRANATPAPSYEPTAVPEPTGTPDPFAQ